MATGLHWFGCGIGLNVALGSASLSRSPRRSDVEGDRNEASPRRSETLIFSRYRIAAATAMTIGSEQRVTIILPRRVGEVTNRSPGG